MFMLAVLEVIVRLQNLQVADLMAAVFLHTMVAVVVVLPILELVKILYIHV